MNAPDQNQRCLLLVLGDENARLFYYDASTLSCLRSIDADIHTYETNAPPAGTPQRQDRKEALRYIFCHQVDDELSRLLKEYPVPVFVTGKCAMLIRFDRWIKNVKYRFAFRSWPFFLLRPV
ncbi:MAG TPA: hypothetical protein VHE54_20265 [Puia sp.]|nr:hypothetical protein [Puia sp.]